MFNNLVFYNHFGAGDLHESREFVRNIKEIVEAKNYYYAHGKDPVLLQDLIDYTCVTSEMTPEKSIFVVKDTLYINTWIGRNSSYVLPGIGCTIEQNYRMFNDMLIIIGKRLTKQIKDYVPIIDFSKFNTHIVDEFMKYKQYENFVLVCNGPVHSNQASNFDFTKPIEFSAKENPRHAFFCTKKFDTEVKNILFTSDLFSLGYSDLNEIAYLSTYCSTIIGRKSGPYTFCGIRDNYYNFRKKFLAFTYQATGQSFMVNQKVDCKLYWSNDTDSQRVANKIIEVINV